MAISCCTDPGKQYDNIKNPFMKRDIVGIYHSVNKKHLHRYTGEFDFRWNARKVDDGTRTVLAVRSAKGKTLVQ